MNAQQRKHAMMMNALSTTMYARGALILGHMVIPWLTAKGWGQVMHWSERKTRYWLEKLVDSRRAVWRFYPKWTGLCATKEYANPYILQKWERRRK